MSYLKIENNTIVEAPKKIVKDTLTIFGYNKETNEKMLFEDGYEKFSKPIGMYRILNGKITEIEITNVGQEDTQKVFTKLQIRRAMRKLGLEDKLDEILNSNETFKKDWTDCQEISLDDEMVINAKSSGLLTDEILNEIINELS